VTVENPPSEGGLKVSDIETPVSRNAERRFPPPWPGEETEACFIVSDANGQARLSRLKAAVRADSAGLRVDSEAALPFAGGGALQAGSRY